MIRRSVVVTEIASNESIPEPMTIASRSNGLLRDASLLSSPERDEPGGEADEERNSEIAHVAELHGTEADGGAGAGALRRRGEPLQRDQGSRRP